MTSFLTPPFESPNSLQENVTSHALVTCHGTTVTHYSMTLGTLLCPSKPVTGFGCRGFIWRLPGLFTPLNSTFSVSFIHPVISEASCPGMQEAWSSVVS